MSGETPDISNLIQFHWYERVYYYDPLTSFPESKEKLGRFVGIAENVGDTLTYKILTEKTEQIICRSVVRSAEVEENLKNKRADSTDQKRGADTIKKASDLHQKMKNPSLNPEQLLGFTYIKETDKGNYRAEVVSQCEHDVEKYYVKIGDGEREKR